MSDTEVILERYIEHRGKVQDMIASMRRGRKFGIYTVVHRPDKRADEELHLSIARFLISHLEICDDGHFGDEVNSRVLLGYMADGHVINEDVERTLLALYPLDTIPGTN